LRILAIILNAALLGMVVMSYEKYQFVRMYILGYGSDGKQFFINILLLSFVASIVNVFALFFVPPLFQRYWFRTCLKGKTLEEQLELVEQARLAALKRESD